MHCIILLFDSYPSCYRKESLSLEHRLTTLLSVRPFSLLTPRHQRGDSHATIAPLLNRVVLFFILTDRDRSTLAQTEEDIVRYS